MFKISKFNLKEYDFIERLAFVSSSILAIVVVWLSYSAPSIYEKRQILIKNHNQVVKFIQNEIIKCYNFDSGITIWGDTCDGEWSSDRVVKYIRENLDVENPFSEGPYIKNIDDVKSKVEGRQGYVTEKGTIFLQNTNFETKEGFKWLLGICIKSPCILKKNHIYTSLSWEKRLWRKLQSKNVD